ncbi:MAG: zf-HC2 domain-containing protein [Desulfobacteraceae bacterium]|nr:MAG: zf-HC2 domain-containing protein [Desulfobacteraceae bacterium]
MRKDCSKYFERISEYLDGELDEAIFLKMDRHLQDCPECRDCIDSLRKSIQLCKEAGKEEMPTDIRERLRSMLRDCISRRKM